MTVRPTHGAATSSWVRRGQQAISREQAPRAARHTWLASLSSAISLAVRWRDASRERLRLRTTLWSSM